MVNRQQNQTVRVNIFRTRGAGSTFLKKNESILPVITGTVCTVCMQRISKSSLFRQGRARRGRELRNLLCIIPKSGTIL